MSTKFRTLMSLSAIIEISVFKPLSKKNVASSISVTVEWCRQERGENRGKVEGGKRGGVKSKRGPAWSTLSVRSCERARMRLHRGDWYTIAANCSNAEESEAIPLPLVHVAQSFTRCAHCVSIVSPFSLRAAFLLPTLELPCVTSAARADAISVSRLAPGQSRTFVSALGRARMQLRARAYRDCR